MNFNCVIFIIIVSAFAIERNFSNKIDDVFKNVPNIKCDNKTDRKVDRLFSQILPVGTERTIPENPIQLREYCNLVRKNSPFILGYVKSCVSTFGKTMAKLMISPINKQLESICKTGKLSTRAREMIRAGECGNKARDRLIECNERMIDAIMGIPRAPAKDRVYMGCCHSNALRLCFRDATEDTKGCTRHTIDWAEKWILNIYGGSISIACGDYFDSSDKCNKLVEDTPKNDPKTYVRPKSFFRPMINLMESFPDSQNK